MNTLMTVRETAQYLKLNQMTVYKLAQQGKIPSSKIGGNWRFKRDVLDRWLFDQSRTGKGTALVIDDDQGICDLLNEIVSENGFYMTCIGNGEDALELLKRQHYDLVFLDLILPGISGVEVLKSIKQNYKGTAVVIITGYGDDPIASEAISMGPQLMMRKPFNVADVIEVLNMVSKVRA
jgi:excisionase family DNA binding protein